MQLAAVLKKRGYHVSLTRTDDSYRALDERTARANKLHPDLFISIHINASTKPELSGIETFCLHEDLFTHHEQFKQDTRLQKRRALLYNQSKKAAAAVHDKVVTAARSIYPNVEDRTVRHRVPQVLFGINSPGVLVELGYLSHHKERQLLQNSAYQKALVYGIADGIESYVK